MASKRWSYSELIRAYGEQQFTVDGYGGKKSSMKMKLADFLAYMKQQVDDSPFYIFEGGFGKDDILKGLLDDYKPPGFIPADLFALLGAKRPKFQWFLVGPQRSGSNLHIDPNATSAWNTLIRGRKRWVVFDPRTPEGVAQGWKHLKSKKENAAVHWFTDILPLVIEDMKVGQRLLVQAPRAGSKCISVISPHPYNRWFCRTLPLYLSLYLSLYLPLYLSLSAHWIHPLPGPSLRPSPAHYSVRAECRLHGVRALHVVARCAKLRRHDCHNAEFRKHG
jgi:hypothetical protein